MKDHDRDGVDITTHHFRQAMLRQQIELSGRQPWIEPRHVRRAAEVTHLVEAADVARKYGWKLLARQLDLRVEALRSMPLEEDESDA